MEQQTNDRSQKKVQQDLTGSQVRSDQDANADRGGTTDMDSSVRKDNRNSTGSGLSSKSNVTGSDFDGQVADQ